MSTHTLLILELAAKSLALLLAAFAVQSLWRGASAGQRCLVWLVAFGCLLALPFTFLLKPRWALFQPEEVVSTQMVLPMETLVMPLQASAPETPTTAAPAHARDPLFRISPIKGAAALWAAGALLLLLRRFLLGGWQLRGLRRRSVLCEDARMVQQVRDLAEALGIRRVVELRLAAAITVPVTWGVRKPVLLLPAAAREWKEEALAAALLHELGHIRHGDAASRLFATMICALHWPNPVIWVAARAWRTAQEQAADDVVLRLGGRAQNYALQLLQAARAFQGGGLMRAPVLAMARAATLEKRLAAIMDAGRNRRQIGKRTWLALGGSALLALGGLGSLRVQGEPVVTHKEEAEPVAEKLVALEVRIIEAPEAVLDEALKGLTGSVIDGEKSGALLRTLLADPNTKTVSYPRIVTLNHRECVIQSSPDNDHPELKLVLLPKILDNQAVQLSANAAWKSTKGPQTLTQTATLPAGSSLIIEQGSGGTGGRRLILTTAAIIDPKTDVDGGIRLTKSMPKDKGDRLVAIEVKFIEVPRGSVESLMPAGEPNRGSAAKDGPTTFNPGDPAAFVRAVLKAVPGANIVSYPRMVAFDGHEVVFRAVQNMPLPQEDGDGEMTYLPIGTVLKLVPKILVGQNIQLNIESTVSELTGNKIIGGKSYPIARSQVMNLPVDLKAGDCAVMAYSRGADEAKDLLLMVTPDFLSAAASVTFLQAVRSPAESGDISSHLPMQLQGNETVRDPDSGATTVSGQAKAKAGGWSIMADRITYDANAGELIAIGHPLAMSKKLRHISESADARLTLNLRTGALTTAGPVKTAVLEP